MALERWQLIETTLLRPETYGGIVFERSSGLTLELDLPAYQFLASFLTPQPLPPPSHPGAYLLPQFIRLGLMRPHGASTQPHPPIVPAWPGDGLTLSAPETVHLALTSRCNLRCQGCYSRPVDPENELSLEELCRLVEEWAQMGVFQLAVGGGEPLLRRETLLTVLGYASQQGLVPNLTTNGTLLTAEMMSRLVDSGVRRLNLSWNGPGTSLSREWILMRPMLPLLRRTPLQVGMNLLITPALLLELPNLLAELAAEEVEHVTLLRPKPPANSNETGLAWYRANRLQRTHLEQLAMQLKVRPRRLRVEVDCTLISLMNDLPIAQLRQRGVHGCTAGRRICTVWPDGQVTACSFLPGLSAGNVRHTPFSLLWQQGKNWASLRQKGADCGGKECCIAR